jgi:hypothetical protein
MDRGGDGVDGGPGELSCKMWLREERQGGGTINLVWPKRPSRPNADPLIGWDSRLSRLLRASSCLEREVTMFPIFVSDESEATWDILEVSCPHEQL